MSSEVGFVSNPFIEPNALPWPGDLSTLKESLISPPFPLGVPGRIGGAELPEYWAVIWIKPPTSSFKPLLLASPGLNEPEVAEKRPAIWDVLSLFIRSLNSWAIVAAVWFAIPSDGISVSVVS